MVHLSHPGCCASWGMKTSAFHGVILIIKGMREEEGTWEGLAEVMTFQLRERFLAPLPTMARLGCPVMAVHRPLPD